MPAWVLTDIDQDVYVDNLSLGSADIEGFPKGASVRKRTLRGGLREGVDVVEVDNGRFRFTILPTRGMGIWRAWLGDFELGWQSPVKGPVHPQFVPLMEPSGIGWLRGFDELLVRCGLESNGAPEFNASGALVHPLHGRIGNLPAQRVELSIDAQSGEIRLTGIVDESRLFGSKLRLTSTVITKVGEPGLRVIDEITNISAEPGEFQLLYHINLGAPLLEPGATVVAPVKTLVPRSDEAAKHVGHWNTYPAGGVGVMEQVYFFELAAAAGGGTHVLLRDAQAARGASLRYNVSQLPHFILWKSPQMAADGYVTGLEPAVNYPNPRTFEKQQGRVPPLAAGETRRFELSLQAHGDAVSVAAAEAEIARLQHGVTPKIFDKPQAGWVP
jgi:hypothetical protein